MTTTLTIGYTDADDPIDYTVEYNIDGRYVPECKHLRNGDPGHEAEYADLEIVTVVDAEGNRVVLDPATEKLIEKEIWELCGVE